MGGLRSFRVREWSGIFAAAIDRGYARPTGKPRLMKWAPTLQSVLPARAQLAADKGHVGAGPQTVLLGKNRPRGVAAKGVARQAYSAA